MKRTRLLVLALMAAATLVLASAPVAQADDVNCPPGLAFAQVDGNVVVPQGQGCTIVFSEIRGNVIVKPGASLRSFLSTFHGNIEGDGFSSISIQSSLVFPPLGVGLFGNVIAKNGSSPGRVQVIDSQIDGSVQLENNDGLVDIGNNSFGGNIQVVKSETTSTMTINGNRDTDIQFYENTADEYNITNNFDVRGNVQVYKNVHTTAGRVTNNTGQNVQCFQNTPALTFVGGPNPAATKAQGQCFK